MARTAMPDRLSTYRAKRDFRVTPEPQGTLAAPGERLRFVVQKHDARRLHYDFRLELDGTLKSWAIPKGPSLDPREKRLAVHVEDHPLSYIDFAGDIPAHQYGAGHVEVWDSGAWIPQGDPVAGYRAGKLKFRLEGSRLHGGWSLVRTRLPARGDKEQWLLIKERDDSARSAAEFDVTADTDLGIHAKPTKSTKATKTRSMQSSDLADFSAKATIENARAAPLPASLKPQLATLVDTLPQGGDWSYEIKLDGYRLLARIDAGKIRLFTRDGKDWTAKLPEVARALRALELNSAWLDGEIVVLDANGMPSFQLLQKAFDAQASSAIRFFLFDLPFLNGQDLRATPLVARQGLLQEVMADSPDSVLRLSAPMAQSPQQLLASACRLSLEGLIGKRRDAPYRSGRSPDWIKLKCRQRQEFVIGGYTEPQGVRKFFGALLLGVHTEDGKLRYAGRVGTGFDQARLLAIFRQMQSVLQDACPFAELPPNSRPNSSHAPAHWLRPELVAEVSFAEWTHDGLLRQASFHGMRSDKPAAEIRREQAMHAPVNGTGGTEEAEEAKKTKRTGRTPADSVRAEKVVITHPERIIDPTSGLTKLDLAHYYDGIAPHILPYLERRPVYLLRAPDGIAGELFFQKHQTRSAIPGVTALDPALDPGHAPLMAIESAQALAGAVQMSCVELHTCNARADRIERPDCMVFDLDPDPALPWGAVIEAAELTKLALDELGLRSFLKTSGGKGVHIVVPLARRHDWETVARFSQALAQHMARTVPSRFSAKMGAKNRVGKVFIDYLRNRKHASTVAPYSARARPGLPVATPIEWEELREISGAAEWNITSLPQRLAQLKRDPWREFSGTRQRLTAGMSRRIGIKAR